MRVKNESSGSELVSETTNRGRSASKPEVPWRPNVPLKMAPMADKVIPWALIMRDLWKKILSPIRGGGIRRRLLIWGLSLFGIALLVVVVAGYSYMVRQIRQDAAALQSELASVTAEQIRNFVRRKIERFSDNADALSLYQLGSKEQQLLLRLLAKNDSSFTDASIINSQGMEVVKVSDRKVYFPSDLTDQSKSPKFIKALKGEDYISPVYTSTRAQPYVTLAIPLWGAAQSIVGVVSAEADLSFLWEAIGKIRFGTAGYAYLVDERGNLIAHRDATLVLKRMNLGQVDGVRRFLRNPTRSDPSPAHEGKGLTDSPVLVTYAPVPELGWSVILEEPVDAALANVEILKRSALVFLVVGLFVGAAIIAWVSQKITRPIQELRQDVATIGAGNLEHRANIKTGDEIEELAGEFNKMTGALQNSYATLEQKVEQRTKEVTALYEVTTAVNESLALKDILHAVIAQIAEIFGFESTRVYLFNDEMKELELRASFEGDLKHSTVTRTFKRGEGIVGRVAESAEPMIFEDTRTDPRYAALSATKAKYSAKQSFFAVFPIKTQSRVFGAILFNARSPRKLTSDEMRLLTSMSEHLAVAVEKASLFRQSEKRSQQLSVLNTIGAALSQSLDLEMVLKEAIEKMIETLNFDASWIYILDPAKEELRLKAYKGLGEEAARSMDRRDLSAGATGKIFETGERLVFEDLQNDTGDKQLSPQNKVGPLGFASAAGFPIKAKEKVIGVLHLANKARRHFVPDELQLIESIAQEIGVAAENARLFEQVNEKTAELGQMNQELQEANRAKSEFISAMSHELRTPLNVIMGNAELTGNGFFGDINPEQKKSMTQIQHHSQFLLKLVNDVLALSRLDAKKMSMDLATVDIDEVITHVQSQAEQLNRLNRLQIFWDVEQDLPAIVTDVTKLEEILQNLIGNAFKFTPRGRIEVRVRNIRELNRIEFSVADTGIGIEKHDVDRIFRAFEQIREAHTGDFNGVGLGLNIVKKYLDLMRGDIRVESHPGEGSTFTFSVPHSISLHS
jgi:signal transduction histidine kinase